MSLLQYKKVSSYTTMAYRLMTEVFSTRLLCSCRSSRSFPIRCAILWSLSCCIPSSILQAHMP